MAEPPIINPNPEKLLNSLLSQILNGKHPITSPRKMVRLTACKTQTQATYDENLVLKFAGLITLYDSKKSNLGGPTTLCWETGRPIATWVPKLSIGNPPVGKGGGYRQRGKGKQRSGNKGNKRSPKATNKNNNTSTSKTNTKDNDVGTSKDNNKVTDHDDNDDDNGSDENGIINSDTKGIRVHGFTFNINDGKIYDEDKPMYSVSSPAIVKHAADKFKNWGTLALVLHMKAADINEEYDVDIDIATDPDKCWPGCLTFFGRAEVDRFYHFEWPYYDWDDIKGLVTDIVVVKICIGLLGY